MIGASRRRHLRRRSSAAGSARWRVVLLLGVGVLALFVGVACSAPHLVKPLARVVGCPARRIGGVAGELASANSVRNPSRTASTAAALMIGLTLVTVVAVLGAGLRRRRSTARSTTRSTPTTSSTARTASPFHAAEGDALARCPA